MGLVEWAERWVVLKVGGVVAVAATSVAWVAAVMVVVWTVVARVVVAVAAAPAVSLAAAMVAAGTAAAMEVTMEVREVGMKVAVTVAATVAASTVGCLAALMAVGRSEAHRGGWEVMGAACSDSSWRSRPARGRCREGQCQP